jgi:hypothetical protein
MQSVKEYTASLYVERDNTIVLIGKCGDNRWRIFKKKLDNAWDMDGTDHLIDTTDIIGAFREGDKYYAVDSAETLWKFNADFSGLVETDTQEVNKYFIPFLLPINK